MEEHPIENPFFPIPQIQPNFNNMFISMRYVPQWGLWEGLREFLQNHMDGMTVVVQHKQNLLKRIKVPCLHYQFMDKRNPNEIIGEIQYLPASCSLILWNKGQLETGDLLLGGQKADNPELIGHFGEGMKLAALALLRLNKTILIGNGDEQWSFIKRQDPYFKKNGEPQDCLFWSKSPLPNDAQIDYRGKIFIRIGRIDPNEWNYHIDKFLWLIKEEDQHMILAKNANNEPIGQILFGEKWANKIYVKDIFVQDMASDQTGFGFNAVFPLDRDRKMIVDSNKRDNVISQIFAYVFNNLPSLIEQNQSDLVILTHLDRFPHNILHLLESNSPCVGYISSFLNPNNIEYLWDLWIQEYFPEKPHVQPVSNIVKLKQFLSEKRLAPSFYEFGYPSYKLFPILQKSNRYISVETKFQRLTNNLPEPLQISPNFQTLINDISAQMRRICPDFQSSNIKFRRFPGEFFDQEFFYIQDRVIYFSDYYLTLPCDLRWKKLILSKCLQIKNISYLQIIEGLQ